MYFVPVSPDSGERTNYHRAGMLIDYEVSSIQQVWSFGDNARYDTRVRMVVDGIPVTDWASPDIKGRYTLAWTSPDGHHLAKPEIEGMPWVNVLAKAFVVNTTGAPLATQNPWTATTRFDHKYGGHLLTQEQVTYSKREPVKYKLKAQPIVPYTERLAKKDLWAYRSQPNLGARLMRTFARTMTGDAMVEESQKYFYSQATRAGETAPKVKPPVVPLYDGPRGQSTLGYLYKIIIRRGLAGFYAMDTTGRSTFETMDGDVQTLSGWRVKPGELKHHSAMMAPSYHKRVGNKAMAAAIDAAYATSWAIVGDWSRVKGPIGYNDPWGFCIGRRKPDGRIDRRDGWERWIKDTLHHRIIYENAWTTRPAAEYEKAHFPPVGYTPPEAPTGTAELVTYLDTPDGQPNEFLNEPWDGEICPWETRIWWTNFGGYNVASAKLDGSEPKVLVQSSIRPTLQQMGMLHRGSVIKQPQVEYNRANFLIDGPLGEASCCFPQAMGFTSDRCLLWWEVGTFALREYDPLTKMVRTLALLPSVMAGSTSAATHDIAMAIDYEGTCGPKDDILIQTWHNGDHRFARDGTYVGRWCWTSGAVMPHGPLNLVSAPGYAWGVACGDGLLRADGNAAGFESVYIRKRTASDLTPDKALWDRGRTAYQASRLWIKVGSGLEGRLGYPTVEELGALDDAALDAYLSEHGITDIEAVRYYIRWHVIDIDYTTGEQPVATPSEPTPGQTVEDELRAELTVVQAENAALRDRIEAARVALEAA